MFEGTIADFQSQMAAGTLTARGLAEYYLRRIAELDQAGPRLGAVIEVNPEALAIAEALDAERRARGPRGPLHGIPILLKDNLETGDRMLTTAGSLALAAAPARRDSTVAARLRAAGAVLLGKTNLSEWANFRGQRSTSGWSSRGGQTRNPYALDRNPCGSSSGSAVAAAADLCTATIGTETDGSIVCPAHMNGIVGLKPTLGLVSRAGIVPIAHSQDTAGPMARTVADVAAVLGALVGPDPVDAVTLESQGRGYTDYTQFLDRDGLRGTRLGVARNFWGAHRRIDEVMERALAALTSQGAELVDPLTVATPGELDEAETAVLLYEFKADLDAYLAGREPEARVHSLAEVIAFNERERARVLPYFGQEYMVMAEAKGPLSEPAYQAARATCLRLARAEGIDAALAAGQVDAIVAPTGGLAWLTDYVTGDHHGAGTSSPAAVAGYPSITVPAGYAWGLPVGISFFAGAYSEPALLRIAYAFEQATQARRAPEYLPSVRLGDD